MKALILAAGYGVRLCPFTKSVPKPLLDVNGRPILEYILKRIEAIPEIEEIYMVVNNKFHEKFEEWNRSYESEKPIRLINDGTTDNSNKLGAIRDIELVIREGQIDSDLLVIAGDNIFNFDLKKICDFWEQNNSFCVGLFKINDLSLVCQYSNVKLDSENRIIDFVEKPPKALSNLIAICLYIFPRKGLHMVEKYLEEGNNPDAPGYFVQWLIKREKVYGYEFGGKWLDVGDIHSYEEAKEEFHFKNFLMKERLNDE